MAKATKKQALGRGLSALLKDPENDIKSATDQNADKVVGNIVELEIAAIEVNPFQPRTSFNDEALHELASSIRELGVIQPITVRKLDFNKYQLVSGERRYRASKLVGLNTIPAYQNASPTSRSKRWTVRPSRQDPRKYRERNLPIRIGLRTHAEKHSNRPKMTLSQSQM